MAQRVFHSTSTFAAPHSHCTVTTTVCHAMPVARWCVADIHSTQPQHTDTSRIQIHSTQHTAHSTQTHIRHRHTHRTLSRARRIDTIRSHRPGTAPGCRALPADGAPRGIPLAAGCRDRVGRGVPPPPPPAWRSSPCSSHGSRPPR